MPIDEKSVLETRVQLWRWAGDRRQWMGNHALLVPSPHHHPRPSVRRWHIYVILSRLRQEIAPVFFPASTHQRAGEKDNKRER